MVEHVFAVAVRLHIHRHDADDLAAIASQDRVLRQPAGARIGRSAVLHRAQERVADERIPGAGAGVPVGGIDLRDAGMKRKGQGGSNRPACEAA